MRLFLAGISLAAWLLMFLAGTDVWHAAGRPDIWNRVDPPYPDVRAFVVTFYLLLPVFVAQFVQTIVDFKKSRS